LHLLVVPVGLLGLFVNRVIFVKPPLCDQPVRVAPFLLPSETRPSDLRPPPQRRHRHPPPNTPPLAPPPQCFPINGEIEPGPNFNGEPCCPDEDGCQARCCAKCCLAFSQKFQPWLLSVSNSLIKAPIVVYTHFAWRLPL